MPTTVVKSIGSGGGRDYATPADWIAACPANLVTADQIWRGEMYNDSEFLYTSLFDTMLFVGAITTDATRYVELTAAAGESFIDHASVRTNHLRYDQSLGVGIRMTGLLSKAILANSNFHCSRLQFKFEGNTNTVVTPGIGVVNQVYADLLCEVGDPSQGPFAQNGGLATNVVLLFHSMSSSSAAFVNSGTGTTMEWIGCTAILAAGSGGAAGSVAFSEQSSGGDSTCLSCAAFMFDVAMDNSSGGTLNGATTGNATDLASWGAGSGNQTSVTFTRFTPFVDSGITTFDARAIAGTALINNGYFDARAPNDISGYARPNPPTIGAWEATIAPSLSANRRRQVKAKLV